MIHRFTQICTDQAWDAASIAAAVGRAGPGIDSYLEIMAAWPSVNVAKDRQFQRRFNGFYRVRQRPADWYAAYFSCMEECKHVRPLPTFDDVLDHLFRVLGRCEASFASKLAATLDPSRPIWDRYVLANLGVRLPAVTVERKLAAAKSAYAAICGWYKKFLASDEGLEVVRIFNSLVTSHAQISDVKKVDFVLWQMR